MKGRSDGQKRILHLACYAHAFGHNIDVFTSTGYSFATIMQLTEDGKSERWKKKADKVLESLAMRNQYIVADMVIIELEKVGYDLQNYSALGGVFKRAAKKGVIKRATTRRAKQALWFSNYYIY